MAHTVWRSTLKAPPAGDLAPRWPLPLMSPCFTTPRRSQSFAEHTRPDQPLARLHARAVMAPSWRDLVDLVNSAERSLATGGSSKVRWDAAHQLIDSLPHPRNPPEELNRQPPKENTPLVVQHQCRVWADNGAAPCAYRHRHRSAAGTAGAASQPPPAPLASGRPWCQLQGSRQAGLAAGRGDCICQDRCAGWDAATPACFPAGDRLLVAQLGDSHSGQAAGGAARVCLHARSDSHRWVQAGWQAVLGASLVGCRVAPMCVV